MGTVLRLLGIGWYVALCILSGVFGGVWLDQQLGLEVPVFALLGLSVGIALAGFGTYRMLVAVLSEGRATKDQRKG